MRPRASGVDDNFGGNITVISDHTINRSILHYYYSGKITGNLRSSHHFAVIAQAHIAILNNYSMLSPAICPHSSLNFIAADGMEGREHDPAHIVFSTMSVP
jgi:hypothetical protein